MIISPETPRNLWEKANLVLGGGWMTKTAAIQALKPLSDVGQYTFERSTSALSIDQNRIFKPAAINEPCLDFYNPLTGTAGLVPRVLFRRQFTNLFRDSEPATNPGQGTRTNLIYSVNNWGLGLAGKITLTSVGNTQESTYFNTNSLASDTYSFGCIARRVDGGVVRVGESNSAAADLQVLIGGSQVTSPQVEHIPGTDLYFITASRTSSSGTSNGLRVLTTMVGSIDCEVSAIMIKTGSRRPTLWEYVKTIGSSVTRGADALVKTGISLNIGQSEGTMILDALLTNNSRVTVPGVIWQIDDGTLNNRIVLQALSGTSTGVELACYVGGVQTVSIINTSSTSRLVRIAMGYGVNNFALAVNGTLIGEDLTSAVPACSVERFGGLGALSAGLELNDRITNSVRLNSRLSNSQLILRSTL